MQLDPIYVNFNVNEQDVLRVRAGSQAPGSDGEPISSSAVEVGLQTETGYPHRGKLDYAAPTINQSTGTLAVRGVSAQCRPQCCCPAISSGSAFPSIKQQNALLVPDTALGSDQSRTLLLVVNGDNVVEQRKVQTGPLEGDLRVIESGLKADDRVVIAGLLRAIPGQKVDPQLQKIEQPSASTK